MIGDRTIVLWLRQFTLVLQMRDQLRMVHDFDIFTAIILVLFSKRVETMWAGSNNLLDTEFIECFQIGFSEHLEQIFVSCSSSSIPTASFLHPKNTDIKSCFLHDGDGITSDFLVTFIKRSRTSCEIDVLCRFSNFDIQIGSPIASLMGRQTVWI